MAITKVPGYMAREGPQVVPKPKVVAAPKVAPQPNYATREGGQGNPYTIPPLVGYTGSGWNYPSASGAPQNYSNAAAAAATGAPAAATSASPSAAGVPFNFGAYLSEIDTDPVMMAAKGAFNTNENSWRRQLEGVVRGGVVKGGWDISSQIKSDPLLSQYLNNYISPDMWSEINAAAAGNQLSDKATLAKQLTQNTRNAAYDQAARGTLGSGSQAVQETGITDANVLAQNTAMGQLMDALRGGTNTYLQNVQQGQQTLEQTRADVAARLAALEGATYAAGNYGEAGEEASQVDVPGAPGLASAASAAPKPTGVSWGGEDVQSVARMKQILNASGVSYQTWKNNHPTAAAKLEGM